MHRYIVFDTETTGLTRGSDDKRGSEVIQFSAIVFNSNFEIERVINRYSSTTQVMTAEVSNIHHINDELLQKLSEGKFLETIIEEEGIRDLDNVTWIGFNSHAFDIPMINQTLKQNGARGVVFGETVKHLSTQRDGVFKFDCMHPLGNIVLGRRGKLVDIIKKGIGSQEFESYCCALRDIYNITELQEGTDSFFHNAVYDALALYMLIHKYRTYLFR